MEARAFVNPVVQCMVERVFRIVEYLVGIESEIKDQLEDMKFHLEMIRSHLTGSTYLQIERDVLKMLKDYMYEADDLLTDCSLRLEHTKKLSADRIRKQLFKYDMGGKLKTLNARMNQTVDTMGEYLNASTNPEGSSESRDRRILCSLDFNFTEIIGLEEDLGKIRKWIVCGDNEQHTRIGIVGMGGLGKTTIAQKVFNDNAVVSHFDKRIWLTASLAFNEKDMLSSILTQIGEDGSGLDESHMIHNICRSLISTSYLIMLDDVWDAGIELWKTMCNEHFPIPMDEDDNLKSSCIIVTTRNVEVAYAMGVSCQRIHYPKVLGRDDSWKLFCKHAFRSTKGECTYCGLEELGHNIVENCGGLPLAIKAVGDLLGSKSLHSKWSDIEASYNLSTNPEGSSKIKDRRIPSSQDFNSTEIIGLEKDLKKIRKWIVCGDNEQHIRIGIVGMGGLGKTTIAQKVFNDNVVVSHFDKRIWLSVSQAFKEKDMLSSILKQLGENGSGLDESHMIHNIRRSLRCKSYLIMLDDVWDTGIDWWKTMCNEHFPIPMDEDDNLKSSCIIVTTRNVEVACTMGVSRQRIHSPKVLGPDDGWNLFCKYAFGSTEGDCTHRDIEKLDQKIVGKCGGLPLAIKTMGSALKSLRSEWSDIKANFRGGLVGAENTRNPIMANLKLSYFELPSHLKQCLLSFAIFPEDEKIAAEQVIYWWVGEGLIMEDKNYPRTKIELGYAYLMELAHRCLIEVVSCRGHDGRIFTCKMHDMVRVLITIMAEEEGFCSFDEKGRQKLTLDGTRWIGLEGPIDEYNLSLMKKIHDPKLRALLLVSFYTSTCHESEINNILELQLKSLRALDVSHLVIELSDDVVLKSFWAWITSLERLAYLNLSGVGNLKVLPSSIQKLRNLQLLVLRGCINLTDLHQSVTQLKQLIVLDVGSCPKLPSLPRGLQSLSCLQELSGFRIASKSSFRFIDLKDLTSLRVLQIDVHDQSDILEEELSALSELTGLKILSISYDNDGSSPEVRKVVFEKDHVMNMLGRISPPRSLQELYLKNYQRESLWSWINPTDLSGLRYLCIEEGNLEKLSHNEKENESSERDIWKIEGLRLMHLRRLVEKWETLKDDMPSLHSLEVSYCMGLEGFPCSVTRPGCWNRY